MNIIKQKLKSHPAKMLALLLPALFTITGSFAQCDTSAIAQITKAYEDRYAQLQEKTKTITPGHQQSDPLLLTLNIDSIGFKMAPKSFHFDLVSITMKDRKIVFNTPQVTMRNKTMSFDKPETKMVDVVIGKKPEFKCKGLKCKIYWTPIITAVPQITMVRQNIITKIPEFTYAQTSFITAVPEFKRDTKTIIFNVPQMTISKVSAKAKILKERAERISQEADTLGLAQDRDLAIAVNATFTCTRDSLIKSQSDASQLFANALNELNTSIKSITDAGGDPANMKDENGAPINLIATRDDLIKSQSEANIVFDKALADLNGKIQKGVNGMHGMEAEVIAKN